MELEVTIARCLLIYRGVGNYFFENQIKIYKVIEGPCREVEKNFFFQDRLFFSLYHSKQA